MLSNAVQNVSIWHWWSSIYGTVYQPVIAIGVLPPVYWLLHHQLVLFSVPVLWVPPLAIIECASQSCMPAGDLMPFIEIEVSNEYYAGLTVITKIRCVVLTQKLAWMIKVIMQDMHHKQSESLYPTYYLCTIRMLTVHLVQMALEPYCIRVNFFHTMQMAAVACCPG